MSTIEVSRIGRRSRQRGASLVVVLIMLTIVFAIGTISAHLALFGERATRNERDRQVAFQAAEAALLDAELDILGPNAAPSGTKRVCRFSADSLIGFVAGCGTGSDAGMCLNEAAPGDAWKGVKALYASESGSGNTNKTVEFGQFTARTLPAGLVSAGLLSKPPRYTIEAVPYLGDGSLANAEANKTVAVAFMVTAMGFGLRAETQVMLQALVYKPRGSNKTGAGC